MRQSYSLHKITSDTSFTFSPADYSMFKFGDDTVSEAFGKALADNFINDVLSKLDSISQLVVISSPYSFIPTATYALKNHFVSELNRWLVQKNNSVLQETKIHRTITYKDDYGELDAAQRINLIGNDIFHIDKDFIKGKTLLFLDDIKITGGHEKMVTKMLDQYGISNQCYLIYFAELINTAIHPRIENYLNYFKVKSIFDLDPNIESGCFVINTRIVKFILNNEQQLFRIFIENKNRKFKNLLYNSAIGNGYHQIDAYISNLQILKNDYL